MKDGASDMRPGECMEGNAAVSIEVLRCTEQTHQPHLVEVITFDPATIGVVPRDRTDQLQVVIDPLVAPSDLPFHGLVS